MNKIIFWLLWIFLISLNGCQNSDTTHSNEPPVKAFDLAEAKRQYANLPLTIADISEQNYHNSSALAVTLTVPLDPSKDFQDFFKVSDLKGQAVEGAWIISPSGLELYFPNIEPSSHYTVEVLPQLTAATGSQLAKSAKKTVDTRELKPQISFVSRGSILPAQLSAGLPVVTTNINAVDVDFHRVKPNQINHFLKKWSEQVSANQTQANYYLQQYAPFIDLIYSGRFELQPPKNTRYTTHLDLSGLDAVKHPGIYLATLKAAGSYEDSLQTSYFVVTDLGLHTRVFADKMWVQVSSLKTRKAVADVNLSLWDENEQQLDTAVTDDQGQAIFQHPSDKALLLLAKDKENLAILPLNSPALDLSEFKIAGRPYHPLEIFVYSPRDLYRPGETVKLSAILRDADGEKITAPPLKAVIKRADGQKISYFTWYPQKDGYYQTDYSLPENAMSGDWTLELETAGKHFHQYTFKVEAFLPERMELLLGQQPPKELITTANATLTVPISGRYLYGAPAAGNRLSSKVILKTYRQPLSEFDQYFFGLEDEKPPVMFFEMDDLTLNERGLAELSIDSRWQSIMNSPLKIKVISSLFETGGRPVTRSLDYLMWPQKQLIGIRPQIALENTPDNTEIGFDLIKANIKGQLKSGEVFIHLIRERKDYYWEYSDDQGWHAEHSEHNYPVFSTRASLNAQHPISIKVPVEWGTYLLVVKDIKTNQTSSLRFEAGSGWDRQQLNQSARPDRIVMELDKKAYQANDTVKLKVTPPYAGEGFIVLENTDEQLWFKRLHLPAEGVEVEVPLNAAWKRHDLYLSSVVFRAGNATEKITPNRAVGLIHLPLDRRSRQLPLHITAPKQPIRPETTLTTTIQVDQAEAGQKTYVTLAAVDVGVLNITEFETPDPFKWFFEPRRYGVDQRDLYSQIIELTEGGLTKAKFGGDADKHAGGARPDSEVAIVALFSGLVETDAQGIATVPLKIPDFNGRLRLMAVAFNDRQFGAAEAEVMVTAPIIAESSLPRFLAANDSAEMTLDLRNQSGYEQNLSLTVSASNPVQLLNGVQTLHLANHEKRVLHFPILAQPAFGAAKIELQLDNQKSGKQKIQLHRKWKLGVRPAYPAITINQRQMVNSNESVNLTSHLDQLLISSAYSELSISNQPPLNTKQYIQSLLQYPYGCLEQTISSSYPWLWVNPQTIQNWELDKIKFHNRLLNIKQKAKYLERGISILAGMQLGNGGFGLWSNNDNEEYWLTGYASEFLLEAKTQGIAVPNELLDKALARLIEYVNLQNEQFDTNYSQAPAHSSFAYKAYAGYVLSKINRAPLGSLRTLYDHHHQEVISALPLVHLGLALINQGDQIRGQKALIEAVKKSRNDLLYVNDYGSRLRDLAQMIYLLHNHPAVPTIANQLIFQLADELAQHQYLSTQEQNALFHASLKLNQANSTLWQGQLIWNQTALTLTQTYPYRNRFNAELIPENLQFISASSQPLYIDYNVQGYPKIAPTLQMDSIHLERHYYNLQGQEIQPTMVKTGDSLLVDLIVSVDKPMRDALVVDLIPAGFELENQDLKNTLKIDSFKIGEQTIETLQAIYTPLHQEYLDDRFMAALNLAEKQPQHLFYIIRAVTKGVFTNPPVYLEDMYRPYIRAIGQDFGQITVN
ncbi:MAG: hypothetical protein RL637_898 [Pseudomonadota bacterium]|jgi:uncharacterized protein YfaS (alpha-2-macroglobulin family)